MIPPNNFSSPYTFTARLRYGEGHRTILSNAVDAVSDLPPTVSLTAPAANTVVTAPATFTLTANAAAPIGSIARVQYYNGSTLIGSATAAPYTATWAGVAYGTYSLTAKATDNYGFSTTSTPVTVISNAPPTVSLTAPANNSTDIAPANITLTANAADVDGSIAKVDFYASTTSAGGTVTNTLVGTAAAAPYSYAWSNVAVGGYTITAVATDNRGASTTSAAISVTVKPGVLQVYYIHPDQLDTPRQITDTGGNVVWQWDNSDPFGANMANGNPAGQGKFEDPLRFPGQYYDRETNLHYNVNRDYDPNIGRYVESDPIGLGGESWSTYIYVLNNPLSYVDPLGLVHYNAPAPRTVPVQGATATALQCVETCLQRSTNNPSLDLLITGGAETTGHSAHSHHYQGQACDIANSRFNSNLTTPQVMSCAAQCGFGAGQYEQFKNNPNRNHWHLQLTPGNGVPALPAASVPSTGAQ